MCCNYSSYSIANTFAGLVSKNLTILNTVKSWKQSCYFLTLFLSQEVTTDWTPVSSWKIYECQGKLNGVPRMFFESNRSLSSFSMLCLPNGSYQFINIRSNWPTCLTGNFACSNFQEYFNLIIEERWNSHPYYCT